MFWRCGTISGGRRCYSRLASGAYSENLDAGTRQRLAGLSYPRQCGDNRLRILVTGGPPNFGGGMPKRILISSLLQALPDPETRRACSVDCRRYQILRRISAGSHFDWWRCYRGCTWIQLVPRRTVEESHTRRVDDATRLRPDATVPARARLLVWSSVTHPRD
jgi:hypothetical protein